MKLRIKILAIIVLGFSLTTTAQNVDDALRYSQQFYGGSARFSSMGGAFTALGGDLSALGLNPAGVGVFRRSEFSFSFRLDYTKTSSIYTSGYDDYRYDYPISHAGFVMPIFNSGNESGLISFNFGYAYNQNNSFNENTGIVGINSTSSMADYWAESSNGIYYTDLNKAQGMAYDAWLIDTISNTGGDQYASIFSFYGEQPASYGQSLRRIITNSGTAGEHSFSLGSNVNNNLFVGLTLTYARFNYLGHYEHFETDPGDDVFDFNSLAYVNHLEASGSGFNAKFGIIYLPAEFIRIGAAVHSPTMYNVHEYYFEDLSSSFDNGDRYEFSTDPFRYDYRLTTPWRFLGGVALQIEKSATVSFDYEFVDYGSSKFSRASDGYDYTGENTDIKNVYQGASNFRIGGEYRFAGFYLRGGYGMYGKAFKEGEANSDTFQRTISGGLGFRQSSFYIDFGYSNLHSSETYFMYWDADPVILEKGRNNYIITLGFRY